MANTRFRALVLTAGVIGLIVLCGSGTAATQLEWKLPKGKTYYQRSVIEQHIAQTVMGQEQKVEMGLGNGLKLQVLDVDAQGNMRIQYTYIWSKFKQVNPMAQVDYDSSRQGPVPAGAESFAALIGQGYTVKMTPKGKVLDVNGVEQLRDAVLKKLPPGTTMEMNPVASYLDKESIRNMTEAGMAIYPDKPVNPGDSWSKEMTVTMGIKMIILSKWTLQKQEAGVATIGVTATLRSDPNGPPMEAGGMKMRLALSGTQEGTIQVAEATGLMTTGKMRQQLKGEVRMGDSADAPMMTIPMVMEMQTTSEMGEQMWKTSP